MSIKMLLIYFIIGGAVVSAITYMGSTAKSQFAAFLAFLPTISVITLCGIYLNSGTQSAVSYAKAMLILLPSWVLYIIGVIFLLPRMGLVYSLLISVAVYMGAAFLTQHFLQ